MHTSVKRSRIFEIGEKIGEALKKYKFVFLFPLLGVALSLGRGRRITHLWGTRPPYPRRFFSRIRKRDQGEFLFFLGFAYISIYIIKKTAKTRANAVFPDAREGS